MRVAFAPLAVLIIVFGAGCEQAQSPKPVPYVGRPLPVPPAPPRVPPRPRGATADAAQAQYGPAENHQPTFPGAGGGLGALPEMPPRPAMPPMPPMPAVPEEASQARAALSPGFAVPSPSPSSSPAPATLASLAGLNEAEVLHRFGRPSRAAAVGQGMRWTWDVEGCEMTMTLFPDVAAQMRRVLSAELSGAARDALGESACLDRLGQRRAGL